MNFLHSGHEEFDSRQRSQSINRGNIDGIIDEN
jgi:hypothetical protein